MAVEEIEVIIDKHGAVKIEVRGVAGMGCVDLTEDLIAALGGEVDSQAFTAEAYVTAQEDQQDHQQLGDRPTSS